MNLDGIAEKALESNADRVIIVFATKMLLFDAVCEVPRGKQTRLSLQANLVLGRSMNLRSPDKEILGLFYSGYGRNQKVARIRTCTHKGLK